MNKSEAIAAEIVKLINSSSVADKLPSEVEFARMFKTTPVTTAKALNLLKDRGVITRIPGRGSFVNRDVASPVRVLLADPVIWQAGIVDEIRAILKVRFPHREIILEAHPPTAGVWPPYKGYDIFSSTATFPCSYQQHVSPLPIGILGKYLDGDYFECAFEVQRDHNLLYGLPFFISPMTLVYNKDLLRKIGMDTVPHDYTLDDFMRLLELAVRAGMAAVEKYFALSIVRYLVFSSAGGEGDLDLLELRQRLQSLRQIRKKSDDGGKSFEAGEILFTGCTRQRLIQLKAVDFAWDVLPLPDILGKRIPMAGCFLMVSSETPDRALAEEIVEAFLSRDIQWLVARERIGLPVLKSLVPETLNMRCWSDNIFLEELSCCLTDNASNQRQILRLTEAMRHYIEGKDDFGWFMENVVVMVEEEKQARLLASSPRPEWQEALCV